MCLINVPVRVFISRKMPPYTGLIWHYTFIKKKKKKNFFFFFYIKCTSCTYWPHNFLVNNQFTQFSCQQELVAIQFITGKASGRLSTGMLLVDTSSRHWLRLFFQATLHTIFEICHPILLFGTILLLNWCDLPPYTIIWHYMFIRHTRVV